MFVLTKNARTCIQQRQLTNQELYSIYETVKSTYTNSYTGWKRANIAMTVVVIILGVCNLSLLGLTSIGIKTSLFMVAPMVLLSLGLKYFYIDKIKRQFLHDVKIGYPDMLDYFLSQGFINSQRK